MGEVRIYHSSWLDYVLILFFIIVLCAIPDASGEISDIYIVLLWMSCFFLTIVFVCRIIRSKILKYPTLIITDEYVKLEMLLRKAEFRFSDVESFRMTIASKCLYIGVNYKVGVKSWKDKDMNAFAWWWTSIDKCGYDEAIPVSYLSYDEDTILAMLNERLENFRKKEALSN